MRVTPGPDGTVTLPDGVSLEQVAVVGRDLVIQLPNGEQIIIEDGAVYVPQLVVGGVEIPAVNVAALLIGNEPQPAAGGPQSSGGNFAVAVGDIGPGIGIGNLLPPTALEFSPPEFEEVYPDIDNDEPTVIIITPDNPVGAEDVVQSTSDAGLPGGSQEETNIEQTTGRITFHAGDTPAHVTINGMDVMVGQIIPSEHGFLEILAVSNGSSPNGFIDYRFVQTEAVSHAPGTDDAFEEIFEVVVTDADGDVATGSLTINIMDDVPDAADDSVGTIGENAGPVVIDVFANDFEGADGVDVATGVELATGPSKGSVVYNGDGTFTYTANEGAEGADSFTYEITDEDGDVSTATVTLNLTPDSTPTIEVGDGKFVDEEALATGSNPGSTAESTSGTFNITTGGDTVGSLVIDGVNVTNGGQVVGEYGTLVVTGNPANGYSWTYTLSDNTTDHPNTGSTGTSEGIFDDFTVTVTDSDGDPASDTLVIEVRDDGPTAVNDVTTTAEDTAVTVNVLANDSSGADEPATLTAAALAPAYAGAGTVGFDADGDVTFTPAPGFEGQVVINYTMVDADGDPAQATLTITVRPDSTPTIEVGEGQFVDEEALASGSNPSSTAEQTSGDFNITTGGDDVASLVIDGVDVTNGGEVQGEYGKLIVTGNPTDGYSWTYTLADNTTDHPNTGSTGTSEGIFDDFTVTVTDSDGDPASDTLVIEVRDDGPSAVNDSTTTAEDTAVTVNVLNNDTSGADEPATLTAAALAPAYAGAGTVGFDANGDVTFTPNAGFEGQVVINYTMVDADGDPAQSTLTITVDPDSTPTIEVGEGQFVDEEALASGSNPSSTAETTSGDFNITTGGDDIGSLVIDGVDVTNGGQVIGQYGTLVVTGNPTDGYSWTYTLADNTTDHPNTGSTGTSEGIFDDFTVTVTDSDGDPASDTLVIEVRDDGPSAVNDSTTTAEDTAVTVNVLNNDTSGADEPATLTAAALAPAYAGAGSVSFDANGEVTFTPAAGFEGQVVINYTMVDADGDPAQATLTITVAPDSTPTIEVGDGKFVDEAALVTGSNPSSTAETTSGDFNITTGGDDIGALIIDGVEVTNGGQIVGTYGTLVVTGNPAAGYSWTYTLYGNTVHPDDTSTGTSEGIFDDFSVVVVDSDGDDASDTLVIQVLDDGPTAVDDTVSGVIEDNPVIYNVINNNDGTSDFSGADESATLIDAVLAPAYAGAGTVSFDITGQVTFDPTPGFEGPVVINYTIVDSDGDPAEATLTITINPDSTPTIEVGDGHFVDEEALVTGSNPTSDAETTSGDFNITTGGDTVGSLVIDGVDVTNGGQVVGEYGTLVVTGDPSSGYSWTYTLSDNTLDHLNTGSTGTSEGIFDDFTVTVTDSDGDPASDTLVIEVRDDGPTAVNDVTTTDEGAAVTYNVLDNDTSGADEPATLTAASLADGYAQAGSVSFDANGEVTFTPAAGFEGQVVINYTMVDADGDPAQATLTITVAPDSTPTIEVGEGQFVDEEALATGSNPGSTAETTSGDFNITTGGDTVGSLVIDGVDVTNGGQVVGEYGTLVVTGNPTDGYSWTYTLADNTLDHLNTGSTGTSEGIFDDFTVTVTDSDGDPASDTLVIEVRDDGPSAVNDVTSTAEDTAVTYNVLDNDTSGADEPATLTAAALAPAYAGSGSVSFDANGEVTFTPNAGFEGQVVINYTMVDADGDPAQATLTITVAPDSTPTIEVGDGKFVDEEALATGSNPSSTAETTSGDFNITTGGDDIGSLVIDGVDVTNGGQVVGEYGTLVVTGNPTNGYSWTYTLSDNTTDHPDDTSTGTSEGIFDDFTVTVTDSDGDPASDTLVIEVRDDGPSAVNDSTTTAEDTAVTYNVVTNSDGTSDTSGADEPATLVAAALAPAYAGAGSVGFDANGEVTFTPNAGFEGQVVINYTIEDADGDQAQATLTITVAPDSTPTIEVGDGKFVDEEALATGSNPSSTAETTSGDFNITTGGDDIGSLVIDGVDVTNGGQVVGEYGTLVVTGNPTNGYSWTYTLSDNTTDHPDDTSTGTSEGIFDDFTVTVTDSDGDPASDTLVIEVRDDGPSAVNDVTSTAEDTAVTYNVMANDTSGADEPATLVAAALAPAYAGAGTVGFDANGDVTFTPNAGFEGQVVINYTIEDADGDPAQATLTITVAPDSTPTIEVGDGKFVDEEALATGSNPSSTAETTSGDFNITTGGDDIASLVIDGVDVTNGGQVVGEYGTLVVTGNPANGYSWTYTLSDNTLDHPNTGSTGTSEGIVDDFTVTVTDSDGDPASDTLVIEVRDDGPTARADVDSVKEDTQNTADGNVLTGSGGVDANVTDGVSDIAGADGPATVVGVAAGNVASAAGNVGVGVNGAYGTITIGANGQYTYVLDPTKPAVNALDTGDTLQDVFTYTIEDGEGDPSTTTITITINGTNDAPVVGTGSAQVSEEGLSTGNPDTTGSPDTTNSASDLDGQLSITDVDDSSFTVTLGLPTAELTSNGVDIEWSLLDSQTLVGKAGATEVIRITIDNAGNYDVVLKGQIDHPDGTVEDQVMFEVPVAVSDGEATTNSSIEVITVEDDSPIDFTPGSTPVSGSLTNVPGSTATYNLDTDGDINDNMGADQGGTITFNVVDGADSPYTSHGDPIEYFVSDDGQTLEGRTGGENGNLVFTIELDQDAGTYTVTMVDTIDNGSGVAFNDLSGGEAGNPPFKIVASSTADALELLFTPIGTNTVNSDSDDIAAGGQFLVFDDGLRIDFGDFTSHPNGGGSADNGFTIADQTPVNGFRFTIDQISNGSVADVKLVTYDANTGSPNQTIGTHNFTDDTKLAITKVEVYDTAGTLVATFTGDNTIAGITADFDGVNGVILRGVPTQYSIQTTSASNYDRIEITNVGTGGADGKFSISELQIETVDFGDPVNVTVPVTLTDADGDSVDADLDFTIGTAAPPIALDLDGDGLEFVSQQAGNVFDYNGDGHAEATAWVGSDDGVLAIDNGDGHYDVTFAVAGSTDLQGLAATYDSNHDGVLSAADADFGKFGVLQNGEFTSLTAAGIESLSLVSDGVAYSAAGGQVQVFGEATFTRTDGSTGTLGDAAFAYSSARTSEAAQRVFGEHAGGAYANLLAAASMITAAATGFAAAEAPLLKAIGVQDFLGDVSPAHFGTSVTQIETFRPEIVDAFDGGAKEGPVVHDTVRFSQDHSNLLEDAGFEAPQANDILSSLLANTDLAPSLHDAAPMLVDMNVMPMIATPVQAIAQNAPVAPELVAEVLADALSGGAQAGMSIDDLLAALPSAGDGASVLGGLSQEFGGAAMVLAAHPLTFHHEVSLVLHQDSVTVA